MIRRRGAGPQNRLSSECSRLAPIMNQQPAGTVTGAASPARGRAYGGRARRVPGAARRAAPAVSG